MRLIRTQVCGSDAFLSELIPIGLRKNGQIIFGTGLALAEGTQAGSL
jgi:hypothetical protein